MSKPGARNVILDRLNKIKFLSDTSIRAKLENIYKQIKST